jgi:HK97 family phage major capsid protein
MAEHNVVLSHTEIKNELHAISENKGTAKNADLKFSLQKESLKAFQEQIVKFRNGDVNGEFAPRDVSYNECAKAYYGVDFTVVNRALGIKSNAQNFRQVGEKFGVKIDNFSDLLRITSSYSANSLFGSSAPLATTSIDSSLHWIIPETILQYIKLGIDSVSKSKSWLAGSTPVRTQTVIQPYVLPADANPTIIAEGEAIPMGTIEFGQRSVTLYKVGTGIKITSELQADSNIDIIAIFLQEVGNNVARSIDKAAYLTIVNGEKTDGSNAAPVIGVSTS